MNTLGRYRLERELGRGGMGVVYLAIDTTLTREVALKVVHPALLSDSQFTSRFEREARAVAVLSHPNIVHVNAFVNEGSVLGIDMPYLAGGSLRDQFVRGLSASRLTAYLVQVLQALDYCHAMGMVHRDVKPSNVLLDERGVAKLTDFGLAKLLSESFRESMASGSTGWFIGTPYYMPPESWEGSEPAPSWDLYATGVVAWEGLTGRLPYHAASPWQLISHMKEAAPPPLGDLAPHASPELVSAVEWMMSRSPTSRAGSAREALDALRCVPEYVEEPDTVISSRGRLARHGHRAVSVRARTAVPLRKWGRLAVAALAAGVVMGVSATSLYIAQVSVGPSLETAVIARAPGYQEEVAAEVLPDLAALLATARMADGTTSSIYAITSESGSINRIQQAMLQTEPGTGLQRVFLYGEQSLWAGELTETDTPFTYAVAGTWLGYDGQSHPALATGTWDGVFKLTAGGQVVLFQFEAVRDQDRHAFGFSAAGERVPDGTDTAFVHGLEAQRAIAPLLFREGPARRNPAALWTEPLLPAWVNNRGVLLRVGDTAFELDGQLAEPFWAGHPGMLRARPLEADAALGLALSRTDMRIGVRLPRAKLPPYWELELRLARADAPDEPVWTARMAHDGAGALERATRNNAETPGASVRVSVGIAGDLVQIEGSIAPIGAFGEAGGSFVPWRCNARLFDLDRGHPAFEWGSPDLTALAHGSILTHRDWETVE